MGALTPTLDDVVIDRGAQVAEDARAIRVLRQRVPVVAFVNNHYAELCPRDGAATRGADRRHRRTTGAVMTRSVPSVGQMVRVLLEQAADDRLVGPADSR